MMSLKARKESSLFRDFRVSLSAYSAVSLYPCGTTRARYSDSISSAIS